MIIYQCYSFLFFELLNTNKADNSQQNYLELTYNNKAVILIELGDEEEAINMINKIKNGSDQVKNLCKELKKLKCD